MWLPSRAMAASRGQDPTPTPTRVEISEAMPKTVGNGEHEPAARPGGEDAAAGQDGPCRLEGSVEYTSPEAAVCASFGRRPPTRSLRRPTPTQSG